MPQQKLILFDFDGTITTKDSMLVFVKFCVGSPKYYAMLLGIVFALVLHKLGVKMQLKALFLSWAFKGISKKNLEQKGELFCQQKMPAIINKEALKHIQHYKNRGDEICIVSASCPEWIKPWAKQQQIPLICSRLEYRNSFFTGHLAGRNCNGYQKVVAIKKVYALENFSKIIAYGNSKGDQKMLDLADRAFFIRKGGYPDLWFLGE